jgi:hypothetical protein
MLFIISIPLIDYAMMKYTNLIFIYNTDYMMKSMNLIFITQITSYARAEL